MDKQDEKRKPLGEILKDQGKIDEDDIRNVLVIQSKCRQDLDKSSKSQLISTGEVERLLRKDSEKRQLTS